MVKKIRKLAYTYAVFSSVIIAFLFYFLMKGVFAVFDILPDLLVIDYIEELGIETTDLVRPPYGSLNDDVKKNVPYPFILWNIDTEDWKTRDKDEIKQEILDNIQEASIILMHDTKAVHNADLEALKEILPELTEEYKFVTVSELFEYYNITLEDGKVYRKIKSEN